MCIEFYVQCLTLRFLRFQEHVSNGGRIVVIKGGYAEHFFTESTDEFYKEVAASLVPVSTLNTALAQVSIFH